MAAKKSTTKKSDALPRAEKPSTKPAPEKKSSTKKSAAKKAPAKKSDGKLSCIEAAAKVLAESKEPMTTRQMIEAMAAKGYWTSLGGQTPASTLYSAILRQIQTKGNEARFVKKERGLFALNESKSGPLD